MRSWPLSHLPPASCLSAIRATRPATLIPNSEILRLREALPGDTLLVVDQAYAEFADQSNDPAEIFALADRGDTVITRTFSKAYGLAGARAGWGYFPPEIAGEVRKLLNPNNISIASQATATAAMRDQAHMRDVVARTAAIRDRFSQECRELGLSVPRKSHQFRADSALPRLRRHSAPMSPCGPKIC